MIIILEYVLDVYQRIFSGKMYDIYLQVEYRKELILKYSSEVNPESLDL